MSRIRGVTSCSGRATRAAPQTASRRETTIGRALASGKTISSFETLPYEAIEKEGEELAARCLMSSSSTSAMVLMSASPILKGGKVAGVLWGGEVLNRNDGLVDKIRDILYQNEKYRGRDIGVATLFLKDVRISTSYKNPDGTRGIGSIVSGEVAQKVLGEGTQWVGTTPVIHKGYVAGYEPIRNHRNEIIGMLAVGMLAAEILRYARGDPHHLSRHQPLRGDPGDRRRQLPLGFDRQARQQSRRGFARDLQGRFFRARGDAVQPTRSESLKRRST